MERGGFHGHTNTSAKFFINDAGMRLSESHQPDCITLAATNSSEVECTVREQDRFMPIANVIRIMRRILPAHAKISDDAKETIQECVSEYISFITGEANERCQCEHRKTITAEDVLWGMNKLGFDDYIEPLTLYLQRYRESEGEGGGSCGGGVISMSGSLVVKRANGISNEYGGYGPKLQVARYNYSHNINSHWLNKQNQNQNK